MEGLKSHANNLRFLILQGISFANGLLLLNLQLHPSGEIHSYGESTGMSTKQLPRASSGNFKLQVQIDELWGWGVGKCTSM